MRNAEVLVAAFFLALGMSLGWLGTEAVRGIVDRITRLEARTCDCPSQEPRLGDPGRPDQVR